MKNKFQKLAIHVKLSEQIVGGLPDDYLIEFPFSIVLVTEETIKENTVKLYDVSNWLILEIIQDIITPN